jgi:hypothetical protein
MNELINPQGPAHDSLFFLADSLVQKTQSILPQSSTEEDIKIGFEKILEPVLKEMGVKSSPAYEKSIYNAGRSDALHGRVVIEYEAPRSFRSQRWIDHAYDQLVGYIQGLSQSDKESLFLYESRFVGVGFDGEQIFFVRYRGDKTEAKIALSDDQFVLVGPFDFNPDSARTLLTHLRALSRLPLNAENLSKKFGPQSALAPKMVSALSDSFGNWSSQRVQVFFGEWKRLFGIVYGEQFSGQLAKEIKTLSSLYSVASTINFQELLFSVHTYFAFLMKLIAAEIMALKETSFHSSLAAELTHASEEVLKQRLDDIEEGGIYARRGITNFLEGDFFRWYLDAWSPRLKESIQDVTRALSEFEPATSSLDPPATRDLLKKLYQYLVPQEVRHRLGEYYTPDWLAGLLIDEVGYTGNTLKRFIDPACGSGTFLVLAIQRAKEQGEKEGLPPLEMAKRIVSHIWGFDLNPLAVIAARTNYLFALGHLANELTHIEIPVYLTDSVLTPTKTKAGLLGDYLEVSTSQGPFEIPGEWVTQDGFLLGIAAPIVEDMAKHRYSVEEALTRFKKQGLVFPYNIEVVKAFYSKILHLEVQNKNGIWARFLKNAFAPMIAGRFDYVVGNPPWIRWGYLAQSYRKATERMWKDYGLFSLKGHAARLGGGEKDFSMLFLYASADYYLKDGAKLGFLITQEVFKSKGAGEGFRRFQLGDDKPLKVIEAHDFSSVQPFEGAANKTAMIILKKDESTTYPVRYTVWSRKKGVGKIPTDMSLPDVKLRLKSERLIAQPMGSATGSWQTISDKKDSSYAAIEGVNFYKARRGASTEPYGVYWLEILQVRSDGNLIIKNLPEHGKRDISRVEDVVEQDLIYPAVRGADIDRWGVSPKIYILMSQDPETSEPYPERRMKDKWPQTYSYLSRFKEVLLSRGSKTVRQLAERTAFYAMFGIGSYTVERYKVVWKRMANDITASVISEHKTPFGYKKLIGTDTTAIFAIPNEIEAHYLCAIINSNPVRKFVKTYSSAGRGFGAPSVMQYVGIKQFDPHNTVHSSLAEYSMQCHQMKIQGRTEETPSVEKEIDEAVKSLFGL